MKKLEIYNGTKTYMFPTGKIASPEVMIDSYPAVQVFTHVIETDEAGQVCYAIIPFETLKARYGIDKTLSDDEAIAKIEEIINTPEEVSDEPTTEERTAQALENIASGATSESTDLMNILLTGEEI